jgi:hypothetical protein
MRDVVRVLELKGERGGRLLVCVLSCGCFSTRRSTTPPKRMPCVACFVQEQLGDDRCDRAAEALVRALRLYDGYTVGSRGPSGCIIDALEAIAPDVAREIRDGAEPSEIYARRWSER